MAKEEKDPPKDDEKEAPKGEGAEGTEGGEEGLDPPKKKLGKKKLIIIGAVAGVLLLGGGGAGLYFSGLLGGGTSNHEAAKDAAGDHGADNEHGASNGSSGGHGEDSAAKGEENAHGAPVFFSLGDILVNLSGDGKRPNFLKIKISLELASEADKTALEALKPRIIDNFQVYLRELRVEDLRGSAGLYRLREELLLRVTEAVQPVRVKDVLFQEMLVQ